MSRAWFLPALFFTTLPSLLHSGDLYTTEFEAFPVGDNLWAGTEGWISNDTTSGAQGIVQDFVAELPLGKSAYLGFEAPASAFTTVARPVPYDPAVGGVRWIEFESFLGVQDSLNGRRDQFFVSFYDIGGTFLAAVVFDNTGATADLLRWQGVADGSVQSTDTGVDFIRGDPRPLLGYLSLQILAVRIDLVNNTWSAHMDGIPLFTEAPFTDPALAPLTLGSVAAEWELGIPSPFFAGDNWLFVADWFVRTAPQGIEPFVIAPGSGDPVGEPTITWHGDPGFGYQVEYSTDLVTWHTGLPGSSFPGITTSGILAFTDTDVPPTGRFYRVRRSVTP